MTFDVARIVPSTRDMLAALAMRRSSLSMLPHVEERVQVGRLDELGVRGLACDSADDKLQSIATASRDLPSLLLAPCSNATDCQRARFFGADGVCLAAGDEAEWQALSQAARSMRMMPLARVINAETAAAAVQWGARALFVAANAVAELAGVIDKPTIVVADARQLDVDALRSMNGKIDAAIVTSQVFTAPAFEALLDELDG